MIYVESVAPYYMSENNYLFLAQTHFSREYSQFIQFLELTNPLEIKIQILAEISFFSFFIVDKIFPYSEIIHFYIQPYVWIEYFLHILISIILH